MDKPKRPVIMIFCDYYLPGYKSGGGMRTIVNMVDRLGGAYDFRIVTRDHDGKSDRNSYDSVKINDWNQVKAAKVYYLSKDNIRMSVLRSLIREVGPESIYTNSFFSTLAIYVLTLRRLGLIDYRPVMVAPCGELSPGALSLKSSKKKWFMNYARLFGLYRDVIWKASTDFEAREVSQLDARESRIMIAPDLPPAKIFEEYRQEDKPRKLPGKVRMAFVSRYEKKKNFNWILPKLMNMTGEIQIDVIGPIQDQKLWEDAQKIITELPANVVVRALGPIPHEDVCRTLLDYHFFLCPTLGENFGHIFLEALAAGCPLIISDRTPWRELNEAGVGWDISLENPQEWKSVINECVEMDEQEYEAKSVKAKHYVSQWLNTPDLDGDTAKVLEASLQRPDARQDMVTAKTSS